MKPTRNQFPIPTSICRHLAVSTAAVAVMMGHAHSQTTQVWTAGGNGALGDSTKYVSGIAPVSGDTVTSDGTGSIIGFDNTSTVTSLAALNLNVASGATIFNHASGSLAITTLNCGGAGGSRNPTYNFDGGILNITSAFTWGNGTNARFLQSAGTVNYSGGSLNMGVASGARSYITMTGGTFNANSVGQVNLGNTGSGNGQANISLAGSSVFNATSSTFVIGQFGAATGTNSFATVTLADTSALNASTVVLGGNNSGSAVFGAINLNGGTISAGSIRKGSSSIVAGIAANVLHANGGTVKAINHANNSAYFQGTFVDLQSGGLKFDSNGNYVTIANAMSGIGGLTKQGDGTLTLTSASNTYTGNTLVSAGTLAMTQTTIDDASTVTIAAGAIVDLTHGGQDQVGEIILDGVSHTTPGTYGSSSSSAIFQDDAFFAGNGVLRIGPISPGRDLTWTGSSDDYWEPSGATNFTTNGIDSIAFLYNDNVTFNDSSAYTSVNLFGMLYPGAVTFTGTHDYTLSSVSSPTGIAGDASITINSTATISLGGTDSAFTGPITVNSGKLIELDNKSFGTTSGITIANGAQVDLNGKSPGALYTYRLNGAGPSGTGSIVNSTATDLFSAGGVKHLILDADATIGSDGGRFDIGGGGGSITGNGYTLTKVGNCPMAFRGGMIEGGDSIFVVAAGGYIWAEGSATAFGGATGLLTIKSGAAAGTFGSNLTISTPVLIESGGTLRSGTFATPSAFTGTWNGTITLDGEVNLSGLGGPLVLLGPVSGSANVTKSGGNEVTISFPSYIGNTTVSAGTLTVGAASLDDVGDVVIETGAVLKLNYTGTDVVGTLLLGGIPANPGTWGSSTSIATNKNDIYFQGDGVLDVQNTAIVLSNFDIWASANITNPAFVSHKGKQDDPDGDGFTNLEEFLFGTDPEKTTGKLVDITNSGATLTVAWIERDTGATYQLQESGALETPWPASGVTPASSGDQSGVPTGYSRKEAIIPIDSARKFVRVTGVEN